MVMIMMNYSCGMTERQKALCLKFSIDHSWRFSPTQTSNMLRAVFEPTHNMNTG